MIQSYERDTQLTLHLYRVFAKSFKSINEHAVTGSKIEGFNPTAFAVMEVLYYKGHSLSSRSVPSCCCRAAMLLT